MVTPDVAPCCRVAVRKAIAAAIEHLEPRDLALGRLLRDTIRAGSICRYEPRPDDPVTWDLGGQPPLP
jgi:hypothetical protein